MSRVLGLLGAALLLAGALLGLLPIHRAGVSCGSAFIGNHDAAVADLSGAISADESGLTLDSVGGVEAACSDARSGRQAPAIVVLVLGGLGTCAGFVVWQKEAEQRRSEPA